MLVIHCPDSCRNEREYIISWVVGEVFGLPHRVSFEQREDWQIELTGSKGSLELDDSFFRRVHDRWLDESSLEDGSVRMVNTAEVGNALLPDDHRDLPVIWGVEIAENAWSSPTSTGLRIGIDILGSLFYLISRYEEAAFQDRDEHDRFPATASLMARHDLLGRAVGNEYLELLWHGMLRLWPGLERSQREFRALPSHDIDEPSMFWKMNRARIWKRALRWVAKGKRDLAWKALTGYRAYRRGEWSRDLFDTLDWIMDQSEANGLKSAFYYIPEKTHERHDPGMPLDHPHVEDQWRRISERGHEIGVHPGYNTVEEPGKISNAARLVRAQLSKLGIQQDQLGGRHHFLRWKTPGTAVAWEEAGLDYDSTLGYAERPGFRCGVCYEFPLYDLENRRALAIRERPLVVMDCSVVGRHYLNLGTGERAFDYIMALKNECRRYQGDFTILWHNNRLGEPGEMDLYQAVLAG